MAATNSTMQLRCQIGSVALIDGGNSRHTGRIVMVTKEHGLRHSADPSSPPRFYWVIESLGAKLGASGNEKWNGIAPDDYLRPITTVGPELIRSIVGEHARQSFRAALADLGKLIEAHYAEPDDAGLTGVKRMEREQLKWLQVRVPGLQALTDAGFEPDAHGGASLEFVARAKGKTATFSACADFTGNWRVYAVACTPGIVTYAEVLIAQETVRGDAFTRLASMWIQAYGKGTPLPDEWQHAATFEDFKRTNAIADPGMPQAHLDRRFFRVIVNRLKGDFDLATPTQMTIAAQPGQLHFRIGRAEFYCPAHGSWLGQATVDLSTFLAAVPTRSRRQPIRIEMVREDLVLDGSPMPATWAI